MNKALIFIAGIVFGAAFFAGGEKIFLKPAATDTTPVADTAALKAAKDVLAHEKERTAALDKRELDLKLQAAKMDIAQNAPKADDGSDPQAKPPGAAIADMTKVMIKQQMDMKMAALTSRLKLSPEQESALHDIMDKQAQYAQDMTEKMLSGKMSKADLQKAMQQQGNLPPDVESQMQSILSPDQYAAYQTYQNDEKKSAAEAMANAELMQIQSSLQLTDAQKDKVFSTIYQQAAQQVGADGAKPSGLDLEGQFEAKKAAMQAVLTPEQYDNYVKFVDGQKKMIDAMMGSATGGN